MRVNAKMLLIMFALAANAFSGTNILAPEYKAVILPSSQSRNVAYRVENVCDGKAATFYESAPKEPRQWIEIRWPQPVRVEAIKATFTDDDHTPASISASAADDTFVGMTVKASEAFPVKRTDKITALRLSFGPTKSGVLQISNLDIQGEAQAYTLKSPDWKGDYICILSLMYQTRHAISGACSTFRLPQKSKPPSCRFPRTMSSFCM